MRPGLDLLDRRRGHRTGRGVREPELAGKGEIDVTRGEMHRRALQYLAESGPSPADPVGGVVWRDVKRGRVTPPGGGGDCAAQMLLGRMRSLGLVRRARSEGSTLWEITDLGRAEAAGPDRGGRGIIP